MLSLAPDAMLGKIGRPGWIAPIAFVTAATKSGRIGEGSLATEPSVTSLIFTAGSAATCSSCFMMSAGLWPGKMRQLMLALARWGRAFSPWPPLIIVVTQVVPILPIVAGLAVSAAIAC